MKIAEQIQSAIHALEVGRGARVLSVLLILLIFGAMAVLYDTRAYHGFNSPEAMDAAQVARNISEGKGFTTDFIRPFSIYLVSKQNHATHPDGTDAFDYAQVNSPHPDLANAPLYPMLLAGFMKAWPPQWKVETRKPFWTEGGSFRRYMPEFRIAILNQVLLFVVVLLTFFLARKLFDVQVAWLAAALTLGSDLLWKFSVSGLSTLLLLVIFLTLVWCLVKLEESGRGPLPKMSRLFALAIFTGLLVALGLLTRYSFGWLIVPVVIFIYRFGGERRAGLAVAATLAFGLAAAPWLLRNLAVSGTLFGTAGYAVVEGTAVFPGTTLMQSLNPDLNSPIWNSALQYLGKKFLENQAFILPAELLRLGGGWLAVLFLAGLLLGLRNQSGRRLRLFTLMCLGVFIVVEALGRTALSTLTPEFNSENLLVLITPFVMMFGVAFFFSLLDQMNLPSLEARLGLLLVLLVLAWQPFVSTLTLRSATVSYPPYYPPDIQKITGWMEPDELMMSDLPWAVAWYGQHQCAWTTRNSAYEFFALHDQIKPVRGIYLSFETVDGKFISECVQGGVDNWKRFAWQLLSQHQSSVMDDWGKIALEKSKIRRPATEISLENHDTYKYPTDFPLKFSPFDTIQSGFYLTDRQRW